MAGGAYILYDVFLSEAVELQGVDRRQSKSLWLHGDHRHCRLEHLPSRLLLWIPWKHSMRRSCVSCTMLLTLSTRSPHARVLAQKMIKEAEHFADVIKRCWSSVLRMEAQMTWSRLLPFTLLSALCSSRVVPAAAFTLMEGGIWYGKQHLSTTCSWHGSLSKQL